MTNSPFEWMRPTPITICGTTMVLGGFITPSTLPQSLRKEEENRWEQSVSSMPEVKETESFVSLDPKPYFLQPEIYESYSLCSDIKLVTECK